ncbi:MAG: translation initiation factor IF-2 subunit beta [Candidatus Bathyarchaeota archaeon]
MSEGDYRKLLDKAISQLPPESSKKDRFEKPKPSSSISGNRTILYNLKDICDRLKRDRNQMLKYLAGELATSGTVDGNRAIFQGKFDNRALEQLVERYINEFVLCPVCHQPDTRIARKDRVYFLVCEACGASSSIRVT